VNVSAISSSSSVQSIAPSPTIRAAEMKDINTILTLHCEAFAEKFDGAFGHKGIARGMHAIENAWQRQGLSSIQGMIVAEWEEHVIGTTMLRTHEMGNDQTYTTELVFQQTLGIWGAARSIFALSLLSHHIGRHEGFITDVAVLKPFRRQGIARKLLVEAEKNAHMQKKTYLGLYVSSANPGARQLYEQFGFQHIHTRRSWLTRFLFGQREWIYMRKQLLSR